uniref:Calcineurin-like phosphoesterase domain-containing protein n=1 Tax=viral metagenome TaxID=1070528 RepID=A0A6C0AQ68_9ZZZZ
MTIKSIYHLSDIHIRAGNSERSREHEYLSVFENLFQTLSTINPNESVIVLTGDLFHNKHRLEPHGMRLAIKLFKGLSQIARTYVIRGNHDYRQDAPDELDLISAFNEWDIPNLFYMDDTGTFEVDNIGFGLVAIQDTLLRNSTSGITDELPEFPEPEFSETVTHKVALFHGSVIQAKLQNGMSVERDGYPLEWFNGYDLILLGDIHLQQVNRASRIGLSGTSGSVATELTSYTCKKGTWAYPGSLLQQDFGEALLGHGLLHWDLENNKVTEHHIHNPYGYVTVRIVDEKLEVLMRKDGKGVFVGSEVVGSTWFPSKLYVRVAGGSVGGIIALQDAVRMLQDLGKEVLGISELNPLGPAVTGSAEEVKVVEDVDMMELNSPAMWEQFITDNCKDGVVQESDQWKNWFQRPEEILIPSEGLDGSLIGAVRERNEKLLKCVEGFNEALENHVRDSGIFGKVSLKYLSWNWLFNYGAGNHYNFGEADGKLVVLNAKNGCGKSNFFEVLCVALFGEGFPSRFNKNFSAAILNDKTPTGSSPGSLLVFDLNGKEYCIERTFHARTKKGMENLIQCDKIEVREVESGLVVCQKKVAVDNWLASHIGTLNTFLSSCMLTQDGDCNFFSLEKVAQKRLIDDVFSLKAVQSLQMMLEEGKRAYKGVLKDIGLWLAAKKGSDEEVGDDLKEELEQVTNRLLVIREEGFRVRESWSAYASKVFTERTEESYRKELEELGSGGVGGDRGRLEALITERTFLKKHIADLKRGLQGRVASKVGKVVKPKVLYADVMSRLERFQKEEKALQRSWINRIEDEEVVDCAIVSQAEYEAIVAEKRGLLEGWRRRGITAATVGGGGDLEQISTDLADAESRQMLVLGDKPNMPVKGLIGVGLGGLESELAGIGSVDDSKIGVLESVLVAYPGHMDRWTRIGAEIKDLKQQIKEYAAYPFNDKCEACKAQPWKKREQEDRSRLARLQEDRKHLQAVLADLAETYGDVEDVRGGLKDLKDAVKRRGELEVAIVYCRWSEESSGIAGEVKRLRALKEQAILGELVTRFKQEQAVWDEKEVAGRLGWAKGVKAGLARAVEEADAWAAWTDYQEREDLATSDKRLLVLEAEIGELEAGKRREELAGVLAAFPGFRRDLELRQEELDLRGKQSELMARVAASAAVNGIAEVAAAKKKIEVRQVLIEVVCEAFKTYRQWLYREKLRPMIEGAVNELLVGICDGRPLFLEAEWLNTIDTFAWFLRDGTSRPIIEKASGFQRFIVGMAMRIAMSRLGICKVVYEQLFIDEGFTACDGPNLEKTPAFLRGLLGSYKSVMLATHLEELKSCGDEQVVIRRPELSGIALICAGNLRQVSTVPSKRVKRSV